MKKSLLALAALGAFASAAQAESSVTLFGLIDTGINYVSNVQTYNQAGNAAGGKSQVNLSSGGLQGSRWGLRGSQDLGNGLKAIFTLESGFDVNTGSQLQSSQARNRIFGRQAFAGLSGDFGTVTIGRQYDSIADFVSPLAASGRWEGSFAAHPGDIDNFNNSRRVNNSIKYTSNSYEGLTFGGLYSLGGTPGRRSDNQVWSAGVGYANGPIALGAAYLNAKTPASSFFADEGITVEDTLFIDPSKNPVFGSYVNAKSLQIIAAGGTFDFGALTAGVNYSNTQFKSSVIAGLDEKTRNATFQNAEASLAYHFAPDLVGMLSYDYTWSNKINNNTAKYQQVNVSLSQDLSKSVEVYVLGAYQKARGKDAYGNALVAGISGVSASSKNTQALVRAGLRVAF